MNRRCELVNRLLRECLASHLNEMNDIVENICLVTRQLLSHADRDPNVNDVIREWCMHKEHPLLIISLDTDVLKASLTIPYAGMVDFKFIYFIRKPNHELNVDNFDEIVTYGKLSGHIDDTLFRLIESIYMPSHLMAIGDGQYVDSYLAFQKFLSCITELQSKQLGVPILYVPSREPGYEYLINPTNSVQTAKILENLGLLWIEVIRSELHVSDPINTNPKHQIVNEYNYYAEKFDILCAIQYQLRTDKMLQLLDRLNGHNAYLVNQITQLSIDLEHQLALSKDNVAFLHSLVAPCEEFDKIIDLDIFPAHLVRITSMIKIIWLRSACLNSTQRLIDMLRMVGNQMMANVCKLLNVVEIVAELRFEHGIHLANIAIDCCIYYKEIFRQIFANVVIDVKYVADRVFSQIDEFMERLRNFIETCEFCSVYRRTQNVDDDIRKAYETNDIIVVFNMGHQRVRRMFTRFFDRLRTIIPDVLDIHGRKWKDCYSELSNSMHAFDEHVLSLVGQIFKIAMNIEEAIDALHLLYKFADRKSIRPIYAKYVAHLRKMISFDLAITNAQLQSESTVHLSYIPKFAYTSLNFRIHSERIRWLANLVDAAEWLHDLSANGQMIEAGQLEDAVVTMTSNADQNFLKWKSHLTNEYLKSLTKRTLMKKFGNQKQYLQCNLDGNIYDVFGDAKYFEFMQNALPPSIREINGKADVISMVHGKVMQIVCDHNGMQRKLTTADRDLFAVLLQEANRIVMAGVARITWDNDDIAPFIAECSQKSDQVRSALKLFRNINGFVQRFCEEISNTMICQIDERKWDSVHSIIAQLEEQRKQTMQQFKRIYHDGFEKMIDVISIEMQKYARRIRKGWTFYLTKIDNLIQLSFKLSLVNTLKHLNFSLHGRHFEPETLFEVQATWQNDQLMFSPDELTIERFLKTLAHLPIRAITQFKLFSAVSANVEGSMSCSLHYFESIEKDQTYQNQIEIIRSVMARIREHFQRWLAQWQPILESLENTESAIETELTKFPKQSAIMDGLLDQLIRLNKRIAANRTEVKAHFVIINAIDVKMTLSNRIRELKDSKLLDLKRLSVEKLISICEYMDRNTVCLQTEPTNPDEVERSLQLYRILLDETKKVAIDFPELQAYFGILQKNSIAIENEIQCMLDELDKRWQLYLNEFEQSEAMLEEARLKVKDGLLNDKTELDADVMRLKEIIAGLPTTAATPTAEALNLINEMDKRCQELYERESVIFRKLKQIQANANKNDVIVELQTELSLLNDVWLLAEQWEKSWTEYKFGRIATVNVSCMETVAESMLDRTKDILKKLGSRELEILLVTQKRLIEFNRTLPLLSALRNPALRSRHWHQIKTSVGQDFDETSDQFSLGAIIEMNFQVHFDKITDISQAATMELQIETSLANIDKVWNNTKIEFIQLQEDLYRIVSLDECFLLLEDNLLQVITMKGTRYGEPFVEQLDYWAKTLNNIQETVELALSVQTTLIYLRNIFVGEDIRKQLPTETNQLHDGIEQWKQLTKLMAKGANIIKSTHCIRPDYLLQNFAQLQKQLEIIQRALEVYLEKKRQTFPRFYFISDDDLLDVLGNAAKPELVQKHMHKLFDNMERCDLKSADSRRAAKWQISGMHSSDGECVKFIDTIQVHGPTENWLRDIESAMRRVLKVKMLACIKDLLDNSDPEKIEQWLQKWPAQLCLSATKIQWTLNCTKTLKFCKQMDSVKPHRKLYKRQCAILVVLSEMSRQSLSKQIRLKVNSIITIQLHGRDVIQRLHRFNCRNVSHFEWFSQLRFYWDRAQNDCAIRQTNTLNW